MAQFARHLQHHWRIVWLLIVCLLYSGVAGYQLGLPGLHYDEAKEAGVNAMELLTGAPVTAFHDATIDLFGLQLPLMVQDYIGALNVYLALPVLGITGIGVPNLRALSLLTGLATLILLERAVSVWVAQRIDTPAHTTISLAGLITLTLLAASPSFVFWSRQGIFVTNLTQPLTFLCIWQTLLWRRSGQPAPLIVAALAAGLALYAKLLAIWIVGPFLLLVGIEWLWAVNSPNRQPPRISPRLVIVTALAFGLPLIPLLLFNIQTGGLTRSLGDNLAMSYYGVDNRALWSNLQVRLGQLAQSLRGDHLWYLGGVYGNARAPVIGTVAVAVGLWRDKRLVGPPLLLLTLCVAASLFTVSDLFITHYALVQPLALAVIGIALTAWLPKDHTQMITSQRARNVVGIVVGIIVALWLMFDLMATWHYHQALSRSGGLADHSDASYHLAYHLRYSGYGAPIALDWGMDATVRFLSHGTVAPIEIFGYESLAQPDATFAERLALFLSNSNNVYLLHAPENTVFSGRREAFLEQVAARDGIAEKLSTFNQRDGTPLYEVWRVTSP